MIPRSFGDTLPCAHACDESTCPLDVFQRTTPSRGKSVHEARTGCLKQGELSNAACNTQGLGQAMCLINMEYDMYKAGQETTA